jgi:hypothetical protein
MTSDSGAPARLNLPGMLDMSSSMPIFHHAVGDLFLALCSECTHGWLCGLLPQ